MEAEGFPPQAEDVSRARADQADAGRPAPSQRIGSRLPSTTTAEYDVLRDDGVLYAEKLSAAGVAVTRLHSPDMSHNFPISPGLVARFPQCLEMLNQIAGWLRSTLG